ncbi:hypothetical protein [Pseudomonas putida]|uniref:Uncharacterized protein n=1 Tax=Pseudomonas putida TaxID=303 RepID=A0A8I1JJP2_PSEPU|nr:hypothetical protein [Pseudomonas putida]MBI6882595.1 hypothetical protein [Pseudomonas putida]
MTNRLLVIGIPNNFDESKLFFDAYSDAGVDELLEFQAEFEFVSSIDTYKIEKYLFSNSRADGRLITLICNGLPKINSLDEEAIGYLLFESYKCYASGKYDQKSFEENAIKLIAGYWPDSPKPKLATFKDYIQSGNLADASGIKKSRILEVGNDLDKSIADQLYRSFVVDGNYVSIIQQMCSSLLVAKLPLSLKALLDIVVADDLYLATDIFQRLLHQDGLHPEYIECFSDKLGHDFILTSIRNTSYSDSYRSSVNIVEKYGETPLFSDEESEIFDLTISSGFVPGSINIILNDGFDSSKFPALSNYIIKNICDLYKCALTDKLKAGLQKFGLNHGAGLDVLYGEAYKLGHKLRVKTGMDLDENSAISVINSVSKEHQDPKGIYLEPEYLELLEIVGLVGLENAYEVLSKVSMGFVSDAMANASSKIDQEMKRKLLKLYPEARGRVLDNDMGL